MASSCSMFKRKTSQEIAELTHKQRDMYNRQLQAEAERLQIELERVRLEKEAMTKELHVKQELNRMIAAEEVLVVDGRLVWAADTAAQRAAAGAVAEGKVSEQRRAEFEQRRVEAVAAAAAYAACTAKSPASPKRRRMK